MGLDPAILLEGAIQRTSIVGQDKVLRRESVDDVIIACRIILASLARKKSKNDGSDETADYSLG